MTDFDNGFRIKFRSHFRRTVLVVIEDEIELQNAYWDGDSYDLFEVFYPVSLEQAKEWIDTFLSISGPSLDDHFKAEMSKNTDPEVLQDFDDGDLPF